MRKMSIARHGSRCGHPWQSRFYSCPLPGDPVWTLLRYIELNPVRAHLVELAEHSLWWRGAKPLRQVISAAPVVLGEMGCLWIVPPPMEV
jgi:hypothetical protein